MPNTWTVEAAELPPPVLEALGEADPPVPDAPPVPDPPAVVETVAVVDEVPVLVVVLEADEVLVVVELATVEVLFADPDPIGTKVVGLRAELASLATLDVRDETALAAAEEALDRIEERIDAAPEETSLFTEEAREETAELPGETVVTPDAVPV